MKMKIDCINMLGLAANQSDRKRGDYAFSLYELANHLRLLMRGECTLEEWNELYVGADREPFDIDELLPVPKR